ncbi:MAG: ATP-binding protein [Promethearchaeota archaeon]
MEENESITIAQIDGKTTPFGFKIKLFQPVHRNAYLFTTHENQEFIFHIQSLWNDASGSHAKVRVIGNPPLTPFNLDTKITLASETQIKKALGLDIAPEFALNLGKILHTKIEATPDVQKLGRLFITGKSGSGKSYTVGIIIEELMKKRIPLVIIDRHGEYSSLKLLDRLNIPENETFFDPNDIEHKYAQNIIEFADTKINPNADLDLKYLLAAKVEDLIQLGMVIIVNLSGLNIPIQEGTVEIFCNRIYQASTKRTIPPHYLFVDEAHLFAGKKQKDVTEILKLSAQEGRKFGHNLIVITQKPQLLDTTIRAQAGTWIIHKLTDVNDIKITVNSSEGLGNNSEEEIQNLTPGEAIISGEITPNCPIRVKIRSRYTIHGGAGFNILEHISEGETIPKAKLVKLLRNRFTPEILNEAQQQVTSSVKLSNSEMFKQIDDLQQEIRELKQKIADYESIKEEEKEVKTEKFEGNDAVGGNEEIDEKLPKPGENYDEKMLQLMEERDDLKLKVEEISKKLDDKATNSQTLQLEMSGIKVENENLKDKLKKETNRADDAVALAELAVSKLKKKR